MDHHPIVLQERVQIGALARGHGQALERVRDEHKQREKERRDDEQGRGDIRHQRCVTFTILEMRDRTHRHQNQHPEKERAGLSTPEGGNRVRERQGTRRIRGDILQREIVRQQRPPEGDRRKHDEPVHGVGGVATGAHHLGALPHHSDEGDHDTVNSGEERQL